MSSSADTQKHMPVTDGEAVNAAPENTVASSPADIKEKPQKDIHKTIGGRIVDVFIYYVIGFVGNSGLSLALTYGANPRPEVKKAKETIARSVARLFKNAHPAKALDGARTLVETSFMVCSGFLTTGLMMPLLAHREKIAYKINQLLNTDTEVLPDEMKDKKVPVTLQDKVNQKIDRRVNKKQNGWDLWPARFIGVAVCLVGDTILNTMDRALEAGGKYSITTLSWLGGQKLFGKLPEKWPAKINGWFSRHGASLEGLKENSHDHFLRLEKAETEFAAKLGTPVNLDRMVVAEQSRLFIKEVGWTLAVAWMVRRMTTMFRNHRVTKQQHQAIAEMQRDGTIPAGSKIALGETVTVEPNPLLEQPAQRWADKQPPKQARVAVEKMASHIQMAETRKDTGIIALAT
jgi:hypothetical protein